MSEEKAGALVSNQASPSVEELRRDQRQRWQQGERVSAEAYVAAYPVLQSDAPGMLDLVLHEVELRAERGETPQLDEYLARFPQFTDQLRQHFHSSLLQPGESLAQSFQLKATQMSEVSAEPIFQGLRQLTQWPTLPGYEILGVLGRGGMGVVYKALQVRLKRLVAIKMILSGIHAGTEAVARFRREGEAVARLQHPNIVQIYEVGEQDGLPFFSLEFVDGTTLEKKLAKQPQPAQASAELLEILARAMHVAHQHHIVHRDLKPANVLISREGMPKITDFGLAKQLEGEGLTVSDAIMGTPRYMAPEQAAGKINQIGPHTDVYALGAILYEMLTGRPVFESASMFDTLDLVRTKEPVPPRRWQPQISRDLETICLKCLEKEIPRRYGSALELAEDLQRFLEHRPILARPTRWPERIAKWVHRRPFVAALTGLLFVATSVSLGVWTGLVRERQERQVAEAGKKVAEEQRDAPTREATGYYAQVANGRGCLEVVGPALSEEQVRRRKVSFKFLTVGGRVQEVQVVNGLGQLTTQHFISALIDDLFERPGRKERVCRYESERNDKGRVIREVAYDRSGQVVYEFHYDHEKNIGHYVNRDGFPLAHAFTGAAYVRFVWSEKDLLKEMRYLDKDGKPRAGIDGTYGLRMEYNDEELPVEVTLLDEKSQPTENKHGFAKMTLAYDAQSNLIEKTFFGLDGRLQAHRDGYAKIKLTHDEHGNRTETACFGLGGRPCLHRDRFAKKTMLYDKYGNCVEVAFWDLDGQPALHAHGYAKILSRHDDRGNEIEQTYLGLDGQPIRHGEGYAKLVRQFDAHGNPIEETYFGPGGELVPHRYGYAKFTQKYDDHGRVTEGAYWGLDGQLILHAESHYAKKTFKYDAQDNLMEEAFFGIDNQPILYIDGFAKAAFTYDEGGNPLEWSCYGLDGRPILRKDGYARITWAYDAEGSRKEQAFWDTDGRPVSKRHVLEGYARAIWTYDRRNRCIDVAYFDPAGKPLPVGVKVEQVLPGGEGYLLGLRPGDYVARYDGKRIANRWQLEAEVHAARDNQQAKPLGVMRDNMRIDLQVTPGWLRGVTLVDCVPAPWYRPQ